MNVYDTGDRHRAGAIAREFDFRHDRIPWFGAVCHANSRAVHRSSGSAMPLPTSERAVVHVVDDDASVRGALEELFESVGLDARTYAAAGDFLATELVDEPGRSEEHTSELQSLRH